MHTCLGISARFIRTSNRLESVEEGFAAMFYNEEVSLREKFSVQIRSRWKAANIAGKGRRKKTQNRVLPLAKITRQGVLQTSLQ